jgi:DNA-binding transcriptional regulator YiaG
MTTKTVKSAAKRSAAKPKAIKPGPVAKRVSLAADVRAKIGVSRKVFSRLTGYSERAIANWEAGAAPDGPGLRRIRETERFRERLAGLVRPEEISAWLDTPNDAFGGLKPLEVIERGEIDRLWDMIFYLESGVAS